MDFNFTDDQQQLRDAVTRWVDKAYGFERRGRIARELGGFSAEAYREIADLGLCGVLINDQHGGLDMGPVEAMIVMQALGTGLVLEPLLQTLLCSATVQAYAPAEVQAAQLPAMADGGKLMVLAHQERGARYDSTACKTSAQAQGDALVLSGVKHVVPAGAQAQAFLINAQLNDQMALFIVDAQTPGVKRAAYATQDGSSAAELWLDQAQATLVTRDGPAALAHALDLGIALLSAQAVGVMDKTLAVTAEYLNTRKQFNVTIGSFQALRHRLADMKMALELARSMSYYATLKVNAPTDERRLAMARTKYQLGQSMRFVGQQAVQLHGGIGVTDEYIVSHYFKALTQMELMFGDSNHHLGEISAHMQDSAGVFA